MLVDEENQSTTVIVPDYQLSLAIGKKVRMQDLLQNLQVGRSTLNQKQISKEAGIYPKNRGLL